MYTKISTDLFDECVFKLQPYVSLTWENIMFRIVSITASSCSDQFSRVEYDIYRLLMLFLSNVDSEAHARLVYEGRPICSPEKNNRV